MKVKVKDIKNNPFRDMDRYPMNRDTIESMKESISETGIWPTIFARKCNGEYQIPCGHHRLAALRELGYEEIDIPIQEISDVDMIKIMSVENLKDWVSKPYVLIEDVRTARDYLNTELAKYDSWEEFYKSELNKSIKFDNAQTFSSAKGNKGVGQTTILKLLGKPWKQWMIQESLAVLNEEEIDEEILTVFKEDEDFSNLKEFRRAIDTVKTDREKEGKNPLSKDEVKDLALKIKDKKKEPKRKKPKLKNESQEMIISELDGEEVVFDAALKDLENDLKTIEDSTSKLTKLILSFNGRLDELGVEKFQTMGVVFAYQEFSELSDALNKLVQYFKTNKELNHA